MSDGTKIEWTDVTWNPITGCSVVSAGCKNCYAMKTGKLLRHKSLASTKRYAHFADQQKLDAVKKAFG